jgi:hypothetical protein
MRFHLGNYDIIDCYIAVNKFLHISSLTSLTLVTCSNPIFCVGYSCSASFLNTKTPKNCEIIQNISSRDVSDNNNIIWFE